MKKILIAVLAIFLIGSIQASDFGFGKGKSPNSMNKSQKTTMYTVDQGNMIVSIGYGAPNWSKLLFSSTGTYKILNGSGVGPIHGKFEYMVSDRFGVGLSVNHVGMSMNYDVDDGFGTVYNYKLSYNSTAFNIRFNWHFFNQDGFDMYAGAGVGYKVSKYAWDTTDPNGGNLDYGSLVPIAMEVSVGMRYFFTENIGIYAEFGLTKSLIQGGATFKF